MWSWSDHMIIWSYNIMCSYNYFNQMINNHIIMWSYHGTVAWGKAVSNWTSEPWVAVRTAVRSANTYFRKSFGFEILPESVIMNLPFLSLPRLASPFPVLSISAFPTYIYIYIYWLKIISQTGFEIHEVHYTEFENHSSEPKLNQPCKNWLTLSLVSLFLLLAILFVL